MQYRPLGKTDLEVSAISFGCWPIIGGPNWGHQEKRDSIAALRAAFDAGVNLYDTAEGYGKGDSEQLLAEGLSDVRDDIVIASKVSGHHFEADELVTACERSLRHLRTDRIDLYQLHWPRRDVPIAATVAVLKDLQKQGKIRYYGVSNFGEQDLGDYLACGGAATSDQVAYSLLFRAIEHQVLPLCRHEQVSVLAYSPLMQGLLTGKYETPEAFPVDRRRMRHFASTNPEARHDEDGAETLTFETIDAIRGVAARAGESMAHVALAWLAAQPGVASVIAGARSVEQARTNARAGALELPAVIVEELNGLTDALKEQLGTNADMWQSKSRIR